MFGKKTDADYNSLETAARFQPVLAQAPAMISNPGMPKQPLSIQRASSGIFMDAHADSVLIYRDAKLENADYARAKRALLEELANQLDFQALDQFDADRKRVRVLQACDQVLPKVNIPLTSQQIELLKHHACDEILGFGPIQRLLNDPEVNDIMINTAKRVFIERAGKILLTDIVFDDESHLLGLIQRVVTRVGRRIDESTPMVDARMPDGSRFNAIIPPLSIDGCLVSIRKFKTNKMLLDQYVEYGSLSKPMAEFLKLCGRARINIIVSGGTGSGKTTLLNALSANILHDERVVTIEDAAELQLKQPHVLRLETRPASTEGKGEVSQRHLVKNALRMRPDRIILGEIRGDEVIDLLSAMNTGHDGSMATIHANSARDCLSRMENLVAMSAVNIQLESLRYQIASAVNLIVQIQRMNDGKRRIVQIEEVAGFESGRILTQTLFHYKVRGMRADGSLDGDYVQANIMPKFMPQAEYFGLGDAMRACFTSPSA
jgi:pilus assembly protein CpaF